MWRRYYILSVENDNYGLPFDHSIDPELGEIETKGSFLHTLGGNLEGWNASIEKEHNKEFDNLIFYCISRDWITVERIYIFPKKEVIKMKTNINITQNLSRGRWYEKYMVIDENVLKKVNDIWRQIIDGLL